MNKIKKLLFGEARCALCLYRVPRHDTIDVYGCSICGYCADYLVKTYPENWRDKIKPFIL